MQTILGLAATHGVSVETVSCDVLQKKSAENKHQGVVANIRADKKSQPGLKDILARQDLLLLVLDGVQDPHGLGCLFALCRCSGVDAVIVSKNRSPG